MGFLDRFRRPNPRWFVCQARFEGVLFDWRVDLESMTLTLVEVGATELHGAVNVFTLLQTRIGWRMQMIGDPSDEFSEILDRAALAEMPGPGWAGRWHELPRDVVVQLDEQHARFLATRDGSS